MIFEVEEQSFYIDLFDRYYHKEIDYRQMLEICDEVVDFTDVENYIDQYKGAINALEFDYVRSIALDAMSA